MTKTILVTGASGFVGPHVARSIRAHGYRAIGLGLKVPHNSPVYKLMDDYIACDLTDTTTLNSINLPNVDAVIHLAGLASPGNSFSEPQKYLIQNPVMLVNLCEYLKEKKMNPRVLAVSSGAVYDSQQSMPLTEVSSVGTTSPYVVSKLAVENMAAYYQKIGLDCVVVRPFNHIGPGQAPGYILPDLTNEIRHAITTNGPALVGNLQTKRDYTDVRDVCEAYVVLATADHLTHSLYNICSGKSISGNDLFNFISHELAPNRQLAVQVEKARIRAQDPLEIYGSYKRLHTETGWQPRIRLETTVRDFITAS